ncbi:hypothetical protein [Streptomyces sp. 900105755]
MNSMLVVVAADRVTEVTVARLGADAISAWLGPCRDPRLLPLRTPLTLDDHLAHPHLLISCDDRREIVDDLLEARGLDRRVTASTTHFAGAALRLATLPALATLPIHAATAYADDLGLATSAPPLPMPSWTVSSIWHRTLTGDRAHVWLRRLVEEAADGNWPAVKSILAKAGNQRHRVPEAPGQAFIACGANPRPPPVVHREDSVTSPYSG